MTSKAERLRRKRAARRFESTATPPQSRPEAIPARSHETPKERNKVSRIREYRNSPQYKAERWFAGLYQARENGSAEAIAELAEVKIQLTAPEFAVLCEYANLNGKDDVHYRIGRSLTTVLELRASALRKLVMYRAWL